MLNFTRNPNIMQHISLGEGYWVPWVRCGGGSGRIGPHQQVSALLSCGHYSPSCILASFTTVKIVFLVVVLTTESCIVIKSSASQESSDSGMC